MARCLKWKSRRNYYEHLLTCNTTNALQASATNVASHSNTGIPHTQVKPPTFSISEYKSSEGTTVEDYFKRFDWALELSRISEASYSNNARVYMGPELNNALKFLVAPRQPESLTYEEVKLTLINHFDRTKNKYAESIKYRRIAQQKKESVANFVLRLKQGSVHCEYGDFLDRMLTEQLLHGLESREMCDEIITKKPATFSEACEIAYVLEATRYTADEIKTTGIAETTEQTHKLDIVPSKFKHNKQKGSRSRSVSRNRGPQQNRNTPHKIKRDSGKLQPCIGCGGQYMHDQCPFSQAKCHICSKRGHIAKVCRSRKSIQETTQNTEQAKTAAQPAEQIDTLQQFSKLHEVNNIKNSVDKQMLNVQVDGQNLSMELNTGAPCSIISKRKLTEIKTNFKLQSTNR